MTLTIGTLLLVIALVLTIVAAVSPRLPLWVPVLLLCLALLVGR